MKYYNSRPAFPYSPGNLFTVVFALFLPLQAVAETPGFLSETSSTEKEAKIHGHEEGILTWPGITGTWGGTRDAVQEEGLMLEAVYTGEFVRNFGPGLVNNREETIYEDNLDLTATLDTEKAELWPGGTFFVYGLFNHGGFPSAR